MKKQTQVRAFNVKLRRLESLKLVRPFKAATQRKKKQQPTKKAKRNKPTKQRKQTKKRGSNTYCHRVALMYEMFSKCSVHRSQSLF